MCQPVERSYTADCQVDRLLITTGYPAVNMVYILSGTNGIAAGVDGFSNSRYFAIQRNPVRLPGCPFAFTLLYMESAVSSRSTYT